MNEAVSAKLAADAARLPGAPQLDKALTRRYGTPEQEAMQGG
jgi:hypothetical protein